MDRSRENRRRCRVSPGQDDSIPFYFVCSRCDAKFFNPVSTSDCPRCGNEGLESNERIHPPWQQKKKKLYTLKETAELLSLSTSWLYANKAKLPHHRLGGIKFSETDFDEILEASARKTRREPDKTPRRKIPDPRPRLRFKR